MTYVYTSLLPIQLTSKVHVTNWPPYNKAQFYKMVMSLHLRHQTFTTKHLVTIYSDIIQQFQ